MIQERSCSMHLKSYLTASFTGLGFLFWWQTWFPLLFITLVSRSYIFITSNLQPRWLHLSLVLMFVNRCHERVFSLKKCIFKRKFWVTSGSGKLKMALYALCRYCWFCVFFLVCLGLDVSLSYPGKQNLNYVVCRLFCCCVWRFDVTSYTVFSSQFMFTVIFTQECNNEWLMYLCNGVGKEPDNLFNKAFCGYVLATRFDSVFFLLRVLSFKVTVFRTTHVRSFR